MRVLIITLISFIVVTPSFAELPDTINLKTICFKSKTWDSFEEFFAHETCDEFKKLFLSHQGVHFSNIQCHPYRGHREAVRVGCAEEIYDYFTSYYGAAISPKIVLTEKKDQSLIFDRQVNSHALCMNLKHALESLSTNRALFTARCSPSSNENLPYVIGAEIFFE